MSDLVDLESQVENAKSQEDYDSFIKSDGVREHIVNSAIKFLQHANVRSSSLLQKQKFLKRKGLNDAEIKVACQRAGVSTFDESQSVLPSIAGPYGVSQQAQITIFDKVKEIVQNISIFSTVIYVVYKFYKRFIEPFLFPQVKTKSVEERIEELNSLVLNSFGELSTTLGNVQMQYKVQDDMIKNQLVELKSDISTVKGLLVSRKQFPSVSNTPLSIPDWQMMSPVGDNDADAKSEDLMELGSGSSSEHEHATKTSDSSLEIME